MYIYIYSVLLTQLNQLTSERYFFFPEGMEHASYFLNLFLPDYTST